MLKGWLFVLSTALLIYLLVSRSLKEMEKSQEALRLSEERFRTMFELASVGMAQADPRTGRWQRVNERLCAITGYSAQELLGKRFLDITHPEDQQHDWEDFQLVVQGEKPAYRNEKRYVRKDGAIVWVNVNVTVVDDDSGQPLYSLAVIEDITERKQAEAALEESLSLYQTILESTADGILVLDLEGRVVNWNRKFKEMWGIPDEILDSRDNEFIKDFVSDQLQDPQSFLAKARNLFDQPLIEICDSILFKDGRIFERYSIPHYLQSRNVGRVLSFRDVTARLQAEEALRQSEQRFRQMAESIGEVFWLASPDYQSILYISPAFEQIWGRSCAALYANPLLWLEAVYPEDIPQVLRVLEDLAQGKPYNSEYRITRPDGEVRWINDRGYQIQDSAGNISFTTGVASDITERKVAEMALRESEQRVRLKLDSILSPEGDLGNLELGDIIDVPTLQSLMDDFYKVAHFPAAIADLRGKMLVSVGWQDICARFHRSHPEACKYCQESDTQLTLNVPPGEFRLYKCKNNMWDIATPIVVGGQQLGNLFSGQFFFDDEPLDYELFRAQARQYGFAEKEYIAALERVPRLSKAMVDAGMEFLVKLSTMLSLLSYSNVKLARSLTERATLTDSLRESQKRLNLALAAAHMGVWEWDVQTDTLFWSQECFEIVNVEPVSNSSLTLEILENIVHSEDRTRVVTATQTAIAENRDYVEDFRIVRPSGEVRWVSTHARTEYDESGKPRRLVGTVKDITEHKQAEEALAAEAIRRRILVDQSRDGIVVLDENGKVYEANQQFADMLGYSNEEVLDLHVWDWEAQWQRAELEEIIRAVDESGDHFETRHVRKDGSVFDVEICSNAAVLAGQKLIFCVCRDISRRKAAEESLRQSETKFRELFENMSSAVAIYQEVDQGQDFVFLEVNRSLERIEQVKRADLLGKQLVRNFRE